MAMPIRIRVTGILEKLGDTFCRLEEGRKLLEMALATAGIKEVKFLPAAKPLNVFKYNFMNTCSYLFEQFGSILGFVKQ